MKSTVQQGKPDYPCIKISESGLVVLFSRKSCGMSLVADGMTKAGAYDHAWNDEAFKPLVGAVTLEN